jgi:hypothetical protein
MCRPKAGRIQTKALALPGLSGDKEQIPSLDATPAETAFLMGHAPAHPAASPDARAFRFGSTTGLGQRHRLVVLLLGCPETRRHPGQTRAHSTWKKRQPRCS